MHPAKQTQGEAKPNRRGENQQPPKGQKAAKRAVTPKGRTGTRGEESKRRPAAAGERGRPGRQSVSVGKTNAIPTEPSGRLKGAHAVDPHHR